jgi:hypothetical protein
MLSAEKLLSATDVQRVLGLSREGLRKLRRRAQVVRIPEKTEEGVVLQ